MGGREKLALTPAYNTVREAAFVTSPLGSTLYVANTSDDTQVEGRFTVDSTALYAFKLYNKNML